MTKILELAEKKLSWPHRESVFAPKGHGPAILAGLADTKIGTPLRRILNSESTLIGILTDDSDSNATRAPMALVCETTSILTQEQTSELIRLAWNFSWAPQLILAEPHQLRAFSCCLPPLENEPPEYLVATVSADTLRSDDAVIVMETINSLHWMNLVSGNIFKQNRQYFERDKRADYLLLDNLRCIRRILIERESLPEDVCHDLLARVIFIQFLIDRKDAQGRAALDIRRLSALHQQRILSKPVNGLEELLRSKRDAYALFRYLDAKFNGDLFCHRKSNGANASEIWKHEQRIVNKQHLDLLADFVSGSLKLDSGQYCLWKQYSFDVIPLEFISSIYEEFLTDSARDSGGAHYTPTHIVDFLLDDVLPWQGEKWQVRILDPSCGSGIFLVKAYQRLLNRWRNAHPEIRPTVEVLRSILQNCIYGVDINPHATRTASFSLYLSMCEEIDPIHLWSRTVFPALRDRNLFTTDFFSEDFAQMKTPLGAGKFDIIVGNAPWGAQTASSKAMQWVAEHSGVTWPIPNKDFGPLFLCKAACLCKSDGFVAMVQPSQALLTNRQPTAMQFRKMLFERFQVEQIVNFSLLRVGLFKNSISPSCIIRMRPLGPTEHFVTYICPKPQRSSVDDFGFVIEHYDVHQVSGFEAREDPRIWTTLMWGTRRDAQLLKKLERHSSLAEIIGSDGSYIVRNGIEYATKDTREYSELAGRRILETPDFPDPDRLALQLNSVPVFERPPQVHRRTDLAAFELPQLVIKRSWRAGGRFRSMVVEKQGREKHGVVCTQNYLSIHADSVHSDRLLVACAIMNSLLGVYCIFLRSGRCAGYRPNALVEDILSIPVPSMSSDAAALPRNVSEVDDSIRELFNISDFEWALIEDLSNFSLPDSLSGTNTVGRKPTERWDGQNPQTDNLTQYYSSLLRVLGETFGRRKSIAATVFIDKPTSRLPVRLIGIHLSNPSLVGVRFEQIENSRLKTILDACFRKFINPSVGSSFGYRKTVRSYGVIEINCCKTPTIYIVKPDERRYWTRSMGMRDGDAIVSDMMLMNQQQKRLDTDDE